MEEIKKKKYYYYKKKRGRKKKRGPKRKIKKRGREWQETWDFKIVTAKNKIQNEYIGKYHTLAEVLQAKEKIEEIICRIQSDVRNNVTPKVDTLKSVYDEVREEINKGM